jgi:hypothetical protein
LGSLLLVPLKTLGKFGANIYAHILAVILCGPDHAVGCKVGDDVAMCPIAITVVIITTNYSSKLSIGLDKVTTCNDT